MRSVTSITSVIVAALIPLVSATCYGDGISSGQINKQLGYDNLDTVCSTMQGMFRSGQTRSECVTDTASGNHWFFSVRLTNGGDLELGKAYCIEKLRTEIAGCDRGGERTWDYFTFRSDPEAGVCMDINFINKHTPMKRDVIIGSPEPYVPGQVRKEVAVFPYKEEDLAAANERLAKRGLYFVA